MKNITYRLIESHLVEGRPEPGGELALRDIRKTLKAGRRLTLRNATKGVDGPVEHRMNERQLETILKGGVLNQIRAEHVAA